MLESKPLPCSPEAGDDFVSREQHGVPIADLADAREVVVWWDDDAADTNDGLGQKHRDGVRPFAKDRLLECAGR